MTDIQRTIDETLPFAEALAREAGALALSYVNTTEVRFKSETDLLTDGDEAVEALIAKAIRERYPDHRLYAEEGAVGADESDWRWLIDPIDGTTNFAHGLPTWAVSICLEYQGTPVVGAVYNPPRDELFLGAQGRGATLNGEPIRVSTIDTLRRALVISELPQGDLAVNEMIGRWNETLKRVQSIRVLGSAALDVCEVACGRIDGYWQRPIMNYDIGAGVVIAREAGATVSAYDGGPYILDNKELCCTNGLIHKDVLELIAITHPAPTETKGSE